MIEAQNLSPETRRIVIQTAAKERMSFDDALEFLVHEGIKSLCADSTYFGGVVGKVVENHGKNT